MFMVPLLFVYSLLAQQQEWKDPTAHKQQFITVDKDVRLEVLDWGGSGWSVVLLTGLGNTAHVFDEFAPKLASAYHVYGITRRGYGASSAPDSGYGADRLGDDVIAVLNALKLEKPILVGHSIGGEELSSVGSRYPDRVGGLIYLDAAYAYAFNKGPLVLPPNKQSFPAMPPTPKPGEADLKTFAAFRAWNIKVTGTPIPESELRQTHRVGPEGQVGAQRVSPKIPAAIIGGGQKYTSIRVPTLAIFAVPHSFGPWLHDYPEADRVYGTQDPATEAQATAFEKGVPSARVVRLPHAHHYLFLSNEGDVLREMRAFLKDLDSPPNPFLRK